MGNLVKGSINEDYSTNIHFDFEDIECPGNPSLPTFLMKVCHLLHSPPPFLLAFLDSSSLGCLMMNCASNSADSWV